MRVAAGVAAAGVCVGAGACAAAPPAAARTIAVTSDAVSLFMLPPSERRADREMEGAEVLALPPVQIHAVVDTNGTKGRQPAHAAAGRLPQIGRIELRPEAV